jgi:8-oxo-dGTP pyrophosphatase MutT (NUDIX family)
MTDQHKFRRWVAERDGAPAGEPSVLIPAATVIVVRDGDDGIEALMLRRNSKLAFAGGMWVFPGGRLDEEDHHPDDPDELTAFRRAAVREAKEEADLDLDIDSLVLFSHWEPPPITPKRFATWFFLAPAPSGSAADVTIDDGEIHEWTWMRPEHALARRDLLEIELAPPTWVTLHELSACAGVADALDLCGRREPEHFTTKIAMVESDVIALWHGDAGYGATVDDETDALAEGARHRLNMLDTGWTYERST